MSTEKKIGGNNFGDIFPFFGVNFGEIGKYFGEFIFFGDFFLSFIKMFEYSLLSSETLQQ